ncbi:transcriptional regulator, y4mF family [Chryseobacterium gleum]|uniref:Transcriptional regulator, y4mF family n=2 Tax=Chryseobacterium gleum TaxID=250 RepID=A0A3S4MAI4_CHRGE|nr:MULTISPECIES: helix-turn-helix domain-containing protein [Chryseobacterium]AZB32345.1 helix-turn-helix domain-containing protein [Chryseobacterium bernardetii]QQY29995.1 helix-turn-helix domain-containing protein [Chryseobacterium gleum]ASE61592.2 helix-turn-helix domain-containing protein [Chryseobacterium indologenes]MDG4655237.1 helix-turn-helix domain-containing protein [Chryseobacterium arthrosphaerae]TLX26369.1 helix-turn-helix domain-containing protein [Chryseobacterium indologenes]
MLFISMSKAQKMIATHVRDRRLLMELTQEGLAERSGVALSTLRKFEQKGLISLDSFLKILMVVGGLEEMLDALKPDKPAFTSIDDVLKQDDTIIKKRGRRK